MRVEIIDYDTFSAIEPVNLRRYLAINGWTQIREVEDDVVVMAKPLDGEQHKLVWLPVSQDFSDYELMVAKLVSAVAETDNKSQLQIINDLETVGVGDVIRAGTEDVMNRHSHTLPIAEGEKLLLRLRQVVTAGASSAIEKRPVYSFNPFGQVRTFINSLRLAQTEPGSYLMRLVAPFEPDRMVQEPLQGQALIGDSFGPVPFARRAVLAMMRATRALREVAEQNYRRGRFSFSLFREAVSAGISANLCEAFAASGNDTNQSLIEISVTWSYVVSSTENLPTSPVRFEPELMPYIREAGREFRRMNPLTVDISGWVNMLGRGGARVGPGSIRLVGRVEGRNRSVHVDLDADSYRTASEAHTEGRWITVTGDLIVENSRFILQHPRNLQIMSHEDVYGQEEIFNRPDEER